MAYDDEQLDEYGSLLVDGPPHPLTTDPAEQAKNDDWLKQLQDKHAEVIKGATATAEAAAASPTGVPALDAIHAKLVSKVPVDAPAPAPAPAPAAAATTAELDVTAGSKAPTTAARQLGDGAEATAATVTPIVTPTVEPTVKGLAKLDTGDLSKLTPQSVETDPVKMQTLQANVQGFAPELAGYMLDIYQKAKEELGNPYDAYKQFLMARQDVLRGPDMTGWAQYPNGEPTPQFWQKYTAGLSSTESQSLMELYNGFLKGDLKSLPNNSQNTDTRGEISRALGDRQLDPTQPMKPIDAMRSLNVVESIRYPNGRPQSVSAADLLLQGAVFGPTGAIGSLASGVINQNLPKDTPSEIRLALTTAPMAISAPGGLLTKAKAALSLAGATVAGDVVAKEAGAAPIIGQTVAPILTPAMAAIARKQFTFMAAAQAAGIVDSESMTKLMQKTVVEMKPDDIGTVVLHGDQQGVIAGTPTRDLLDIQLQNGVRMTVPRAEVLVVPASGSGATLASEASRLRAGAEPPNYQTPLHMTPDAIDQLPVGETRIHYTDSANVQSIFSDGFKPSPASREALPGVYVTDSTAKIAEGTSGRQAMFVEVPNGPMATAEVVDMARRNLGTTLDEAGQTELTDYLKKQGYVGAQMRPGTEVYFDPASVKPKLAASTGQWDDFVQVAKGVMSGDARVTAVRSVGGGASPLPDLSPELNSLADAVSNNTLDLRMASVGMRAAAEIQPLPITVPGKVFARVRAMATLQPGILKATTPAVMAAGHYEAAQGAELATRLLFLKKAVKEGFGEQFYQNPEQAHLMPQYIGPALTGKVSDYVVGTLLHAIDHPELYNLSAKQTQVIDFWQTLLKNDFELTKSFGVKGEVLDKNYVPYRYSPTDKSWWDRVTGVPDVTGTSAGGAGGGGVASRSFAKHRYSDSIDAFAETLAADGQRVELDPFKLYQQRLQGSMRLRTQNMFLNGTLRAYGVKLETSASQTALREEIAQARGSIRGKMSTSIRRGTRETVLGQSADYMDSLLGKVEDELRRVDDQIGTKTPITQDTFVHLTSALWTLDKEATRVGGFAVSAGDRAQAAAAKAQITRDELIGLHAKVDRLKAMVRPVGAPHGWVEVPNAPIEGRWAVPTDVANEINAVTKPQQQGIISGPVNSFLDTARSWLLSADASFFTHQGYNYLSVDPLNGFKKFGQAAMISATEEGYLTHLAHNLPAYTSMAQAGGTIFMDANDVLREAGGGIKGIGGKLSDNVPVLGQVKWFNDSTFGRLAPQMKLLQWKSMTQMLDNLQGTGTGLGNEMQTFMHDLPVIGPALKKLAGVENMSPTQLQKAAADVMNNVGGGIDWDKVGMKPTIGSKVIFLTEGWLRANVGNITMAARIGDPRGVLARRFLFQQLAITAMLSTGYALANGSRMPNYDPTASDFLDVQVGDETKPGGAGSISLLPGKSYIRTIFRELAGTPTTDGRDQSAKTRVEQLFRFGEGRVGQPLSMIADLESGKDYLGRPIDNNLLHIAKGVMPVAVQSLTETLQGQHGWADPASQFAGLNYIPKSPYDARDKMVQQLGLKDQVDQTSIGSYAEMSTSQRDAFDTAHPEYSKAITQFQDERQSPFAEAAHLRAQKTSSIEALGKAFRGEDLTDADLQALGPNAAPDQLAKLRNDPKAYREMMADLAVMYRYKTDTLLRNAGTSAPASTQQKIVSDYYSEVIDQSVIGGTLNYDVLDQKDRAYRQKVQDQYGDNGISVLDAETAYHASDDTVAAALHKDQAFLNPYYNNQDSFWNADALKQVAGFNDEVAADASSNYGSVAEYKQHLTDAYVESLKGEALPPNIANMSISGESLAKHYGIPTGSQLTTEQARLVAEQLVSKTFAKYDAAVLNENNKYLRQHPETACALKYWGYSLPADSNYLLSTCDVR